MIKFFFYLNVLLFFMNMVALVLNGLNGQFDFNSLAGAVFNGSFMVILWDLMNPRK